MNKYNEKEPLFLEKCEKHLFEIQDLYEPLIEYYKKLDKLIISQQQRTQPNNETLFFFLEKLGDIAVIELSNVVTDLKEWIKDYDDFEDERCNLGRMEEKLKPLRNVFAHRLNPYTRDKKKAKDISLTLNDFLSFFKELKGIFNKIGEKSDMYDDPLRDYKASTQPLNINNMTVVDFFDVCKKEDVDGIDRFIMNLYMITSREFRQYINSLALLNMIPHLFSFMSRIEKVGKYGKIKDIRTRNLIESHKKSEHVCYRCAQVITATSDHTASDDIDDIIKLVTGINPRLIQNTDDDKASAQPLNINNMTVSDFLDVCKKEKIDGIDHFRRDLDMMTSHTFKQSINHLALLNRIPHLFSFISRIEEIGKYGKITDGHTRSLIDSHKRSEHVCYRCAEVIKAAD